MGHVSVQDVIDRLVKESSVISTREVASKAGVSRQAAHKQLRALVAQGLLRVEGKARAARYLSTSVHPERSRGAPAPMPSSAHPERSRGALALWLTFRSSPPALPARRHLPHRVRIEARRSAPVEVVRLTLPQVTFGPGALNGLATPPTLRAEPRRELSTWSMGDFLRNWLEADRDAAQFRARAEVVVDEPALTPMTSADPVDDAEEWRNPEPEEGRPDVEPYDQAGDLWRWLDEEPHAPARVVVDETAWAAPVDDSGEDEPLYPVARRPARVDDSVLPERVHLDVAPAGSLFRLSARFLLADVNARSVVLDFSGVEEVGDEFLEELFQVLPRRQPGLRLEAVNVPVPLRRQVLSFRR